MDPVLSSKIARKHLLIKMGVNMSGYFALTDVNLGMDSSLKFDWITLAGRQMLICNSSELTDVEKLMLLANSTLI